MENAFKRMRDATGLKQIDAAASLGVSQPTISAWETGDALPRTEMLLDIAKLYGCTVDMLLAKPEEEKEAKTHDTATAQVDPAVPPAAAPEAPADRPAAAVPAAGSASGGVAGKHADVPPWVSTDGEDDGDMSWLVE